MSFDVVQEPKISIVIPCYNYGKYVEEAVESCLNSTLQDIEILIVNDGSTDEYTLDVLNKMNKPKTRVIHQVNKGLPAARNTGFSQARAKYILPLDADDLIEPTLLEKAYWVMEFNSNLGFVSFWLKHFGDEDWIWMPPAFNLQKLLYENTVTVTSLVRKQAWEDAGGYNEEMRLGYEDWDFWISLAEAGWEGTQIPEPLFLYRKHGRTMINSSREKHDIIVEQIRNNHPRLYKGDLAETDNEFKEKKKFLNERRINIAKNFSRKYLPNVMDRFLRKIYKKMITSQDKQLSAVPLNVVVPISNNELPPENIRVSEYSVSLVSDEKIKLLFIVPWLEIGGADKVNLDLLSHLDTDKYQVTIVTTLKSTNPWQDKFKEITNDIFHLPNYTTDQKYYDCMIDLIIQTRGIQLIQISNSMEGYNLLPFIKEKNKSLPIVALIHNYVPEDPWDYARVSAKFDSYIDKYVTITKSLKDIMVNILNVNEEKITVIENGVDETVFYPIENKSDIKKELGVPKDKKVVAFIGRFRYEKEPLKFVRIAELIAQSDIGKNCIFLMVGDGELFEEVKQTINQSAYREQFILTGARNDISEILREVSILIAPSQREGLPIIGLEAMAVGVPVVASKVPGWVDLISENFNGFLVDFKDHDAFAKAGIELIRDSITYKRISIASRETILNQYTLKKFAQKYEMIYEEERQLKN